MDDTSVVGEYTLMIPNITVADNGTYTCIDEAGFGPDIASASLHVIGKNIINERKLPACTFKKIYC